MKSDSLNNPFFKSKRKARLFAYYLLPIAYWLTIVQCKSQDTINFQYKSYGLEKDSANVIQNAAHLDDFYENLYQLKYKNDRKINIIHLGDSHIQGDYMTSIVRRNLQKEFGNAGRGLVVPARVAGTNEAFNIQTSSNVSWNSKRIIYPALPLPIGIGGITIHTDRVNAQLVLNMNDLWMDYSFNTVTLFFQKDISSFDFSVKDTSGLQLDLISSLTHEPFVNYSKIILHNNVNGIVFETLKSAPDQTQATIFGVNLENSKNGILYHAIGVNGAKYTHYNSALYFTRQTSALNPDLFIISLGTNESLDFPNMDKNFPQHIEKLIASLRENNPGAKFILVTPPDAFRSKSKINPGILKIRDQIIQYAVENGFAFWDMYKALGGENSAEAWRKLTLLRADGVHNSKDGYEYQGNLLYHALIKGYNNYVSNRPR